MLKKIGKGITIVNAAAFVIVIFVGAISIFITKDILHNEYKIQGVSKDIVITNSIHSDIYRLIREMHHFLLEEDDLSSKEALVLIAKIKKKVEDYKNHELKESANGNNQEITSLNKMLADIDKLYAMKNLINTYSSTGKYESDDLIELEEYAYNIEETTNEINVIHLHKIARWINESLDSMWRILFIYLVFIVLGSLIIYTGHRALLRKVVNPIKELASATLEFAEGTYDKRVKTTSQTEIGTLYASFNKMAEELQEHDEMLRKFNEELEKKVGERTYELQNANVQLRMTRDALIRTEKIAAVGQIAAGVTHEIKNPLNSLSINTQMLLKDLAQKFGPDSPTLESASLIKFEINRINNILEEFVNFAKFPEPKFFDNNINQVINEVVNLISDNAKDAEVMINMSLQDDIPVFNFDARQFKEIFINLIQNSIKAMKNGGTLEIISKIENVTNVLITISDNGEGISEKNIDKIFTPFFSTKEGGLGLGLPIVQKIVESHGGKIKCSSKHGDGTVFDIIIPLERV